MGTRADFYVGQGPSAEWIGSIAWDGYREGIEDAVLQAATEAEFRSAVAAFFSTRDDVTLPERGWPWPWDTSAVTDCSYWFFDGKVWDETRGTYTDCSVLTEDGDARMEAATIGPRIVFPDMSALKKPALAGPRSGLIVIGSSS